MIKEIDWMQGLAGLGLFFFSIRYLSSALERSLSRRLRPVLNQFLANPSRSLMAGLMATSLVQASSITIAASMGLLHNSLITLEQAFLVMLGATLGTTIKAWFFAEQFHTQAGPLLVGLSSLALLFVRVPRLRSLLEAASAVGFSFLGLAMLSNGLQGILDNPDVVQLLRSYDALSLPSQLLGILVGMTLTMALQSSSTLIFLVLEFAAGGLLTFPQGLSLILGANIGSAFPNLLASIEYGKNVRRLALGHLLVKVAGVSLIVLLFGPFLAGIDMVIPGNGNEMAYLPTHLAAAHTAFNLINLIIWSILLNLLIRLLCWLIPSSQDGAMQLSLVVRRMLTHSAPHALEEADIQLDQGLNITKAMSDHCLILLNQPDIQKASRFNLPLVSSFDLVRDSIYELILPLSTRQNLGADQQQKVYQLMRLVGDCNQLYQTTLLLKEHLEHGILNQNYRLPEAIDLHIPGFQRELNEVWLAILLRRATLNNADALDSTLEHMESYFVQAAPQDKLDQAYLNWMGQTLALLRQTTSALYQLYLTACQK
jgi:phosphate:Na+ symporter